MVKRNGIVVVEDERFIRTALVTLIEDCGFSPLEASDGDKAVQILEQNANHVLAVIADIQLPNSMNGILLVKHVQKHWPWIHTILTSGREAPGEAAIPSDTRFFQKPLVFRALLDHLLGLQQK